MKTRLLPVEEWPRLAGTLLETAWPQLDPLTTSIVVVEDEGRILGCWAVFRVWHVEGAWIAPEHRGRSTVGRRLLRGMRSLLRSVGIRDVWMMTTNDDTAAMAQRLGRSVELDGRHFSLVMET